MICLHKVRSRKGTMQYRCQDTPQSYVEVLSSVLTVPWLNLLSEGMAQFVDATYEEKYSAAIRKGLLGPVYLLLALLLLPSALLGYVLWVALCTLGPERTPYRYLYTEPNSQHSASKTYTEGRNSHRLREPASTNYQSESECTDADASEVHKRRFTFLTSNVLLGPNVLVKFNNGRKTSDRIEIIASRLLNQNPELNRKANLLSSMADLRRKHSVAVDQVPWTDVLLLQEVFSLSTGHRMATLLSSQYPYCLYGVAQHSISTNRCCLDSGLFLASRHPILAAHFRPFTRTTKFGKFLAYGALFAKLHFKELGPSAVAYVTNLHTQAYDETLLDSQIEEAEQWSEEFVQATLEEGETVVCRLIGGDFNCDNISPADVSTQHHPIWRTYHDPCRIGPGQEQPWAIGTELRQRMMHKPEPQCPETFADILRDDVGRRHFVLDAVVEKHTFDLMFCGPKPDDFGNIASVPWGGLRRLDKILLHKPSTIGTHPSDLPLENNEADEEQTKDEDAEKSTVKDVKTTTENFESETKSSLSGSESGKVETGFERLYGKVHEDVSTTDLPVVTSVWFPSVLGGLSDHLPHVVQVEVARPT